MVDLNSKASNPKHNVWISASAGSGKTKTLTDRVLRLLLDGNQPAKILCLTFTKLAAAEMQSRIMQQLAKWVTLDQQTLTQELSLLCGFTPNTKQIALAQKLLFTVNEHEHPLKIQTIHSFCQSIIVQFPMEGAHFNQDIIDETEQSILLEQAKINLLNHCDLDPTTLDSIRSLLSNGEYSFHTLVDLAINSRSKLEHNASYNVEDLYNRFLHYANPELLQHYPDYKTCDQVFNARYITAIKPYYQQWLNAHNNQVDLATLVIKAYVESAITHYDEIYDAFYTTTGSLRKTILNKKILEQSCLEEALSALQIEVESYKEAKASALLAEDSTSFYQLLKLIDYHYQVAKKNKLDYDDLIKLVLSFLNNEDKRHWLTYKLDHQIEHVLVDESQDVSLQQWQIIITLINNFFDDLDNHNQPKTVFIVGDYKQSIFSFQGADPYIFEAMNRRLSEYVASYEKQLQQIELSKSYRSGEAILKAVDLVFADRNFNQHLAHKNIASKVVLWPSLIKIKEDDDKDDYQWKIPSLKSIKQYQPMNILAKIIAKRVLEMINHEKMQPRDIMILIRKRDQFSQQLMLELDRFGIANSGLDRVYLQENLAIKDLLSLINFILLPEDDYNLACLLKTPFFAISEQELLSLTLIEGRNLWEKISLGRLQPIYQKLKTILQDSSLHTPYNLLVHLLDVENYRNQFIGYFGQQINEVIDEFLNLCLQYQNKHGGSLQQFVHWFKNSDLVIKRSTSAEDNVVQIMTIHAAKGLQARTVILADATSTPTITYNPLWDSELELLLYKFPQNIANKLYQDLANKHQLNQMEEYYRLLYVAMTRAIDRLEIFGYSNTKNISERSWYAKISKAFENTANSEPCNELCGWKISQEEDTNEGCHTNTNAKYILSNSGEEMPYHSSTKSEIEKFEIFAKCEPKPSSNATSQHFALSPLDSDHRDRGINLHKQLELYIKHQIPPEESLNGFVQQLHDFLPSHAELFTEVPISQEDVIGVIDLLAVTDNTVYVIDYKSRLYHQFTEIEPDHLQQIQTYVEIVKAIYPDHQVKGYIGSISGKSFIKII